MAMYVIGIILKHAAILLIYKTFYRVMELATVLINSNCSIWNDFFLSRQKLNWKVLKVLKLLVRFYN